MRTAISSGAGCGVVRPIAFGGWSIRAWAVAGLLALLVAMVAISRPAAAAERTLPDYRISAEDVLDVSVWREEDLQGQVTVRPDGGISFPLVGDIQAAGKTPKELEAEIAERIREYVPEAVVTVSIVELQGLRIYVSGSVQNPGQYVVGRYVDVLQALALAGGLTPFANANDIRVIRRVNGREQVYEFNYREVQRGVNLKQNILLQPDDVVVVP